MSLTYPEDTTIPFDHRIDSRRADLPADEPFVPVYARRGKARGGRGKIKTWMILAPVGVLTLGGIGAMMAMNGGDEVPTPLVEPARTGPVLSVAPTATPETVLTPALTPGPVVAAPVVREAAPTRANAPARAPAPAAVTPRVETAAPAVPAGPQPYAPASAAPSTATLNTAPVAPATPPVIVLEPVG